MKNVNREDILRMVGLHGAVNLMRAINNIQLAMEEQDGKLVTYWTEIQKDEKQISLIAGRMTDAETNIGQLQVTAQQITASVSSLKTTVDGHTESIGQLTITSQQLTASVSSLNTTVSGHTSKISSLELTDQSLTASVSSLNTTVSGHTSKISSLELTDQNLTASVSSLNTTVSGHTSKIAALEITDSSISNRVTVIEGDYVKEAEISLMVKKDGNGYISNANIKADNIDFTFTRATNFISGGQTVMNIDSSGNLWIAGEYKGGSITGNITVGTGTKKMYIEPTSSGARLVGKEGSTEVLSLGFNTIGSEIVPSLKLGSSYMKQTSGQFYGSFNNGLSTLEYNLYYDSSTVTFYNSTSSSNVVQLTVGVNNRKAFIRATNYGGDAQMWPTEGVDDINSLPIGTIYLRSDSSLGVKR